MSGSSSSRGVLFINPSSGTRLRALARQELEARARDAGLRIIEITPDMQVGEVIRERRARGDRLFLAAGGDGTINHVAQGVAGSDAVLGVIPLGTYNHFAKDAGIPLDWSDALEVALAEKTIRVDTARVNGRTFLNNMSLGLYPDAVRRREEKGRDYPRWRALPYAAFMTIRKFRHASLDVELPYGTEHVKTQIFIISNNPYDISVVGMRAPRTTLDGGMLAIYWLPKMPRLRFVAVVASYIGGKAAGMPALRAIEAERVTLRTEHSKVRVGMDGEVVTMRSPLEVRIVPRSLSVRVP